MRFQPTPLAGAWVIELEPVADERGFFARTFCERELGAHGLVTRFVQHNVSFNPRRGTLRGLHFQEPPHEEAKIVSCRLGRVRDVIVDLRDGSSTRGRWFATDLDRASGRALYVPAGFAHGFQTLEPDTEVSYLMSSLYEPSAARGVSPFDPELGIDWPLPREVFASERDRGWPPLAALATSTPRA